MHDTQKHIVYFQLPGTIGVNASTSNFDPEGLSSIPASRTQILLLHPQSAHTMTSSFPFIYPASIGWGIHPVRNVCNTNAFTPTVFKMLPYNTTIPHPMSKTTNPPTPDAM